MAGQMKIGAGIALDGEKEFKKAISDINKDLAVLGSEMGKVTAQFGTNANSMDALKAKSEVYNKQIEEQKKKIDTLKVALAGSAEEFGENDTKTKNWQISLNRAEAELAKTENALKENEEAIKNFGKNADEASGKFSNFGGVLKATAATMATVGAAALVAAAQLGKAVLSSYADYEQLVGGIDTLFKESSAKMQEYAANAYKTAGLSANDYMETVTSFSASLISSLGGDTEKAVEYADMAITDMSDNANKMGTDMALIQNAYQGFAKQNYTMLDNLKLGYGGTKQEMERLLKDAEKISGIKYDISSYADVVEAIHVIQENMGIAGTTAQEAEKTITGSLNAMKSAWQNWIVGLGTSDADMEQLTNNLKDAFGNVVNNVVPVIEHIAKALPNAIGTMLPAIGQLLPVLLETVTSLFKEVLDAILGMLPELMPVAVQAMLTIVDALIENLPLIIDAAFVLITALANGIVEALPELVPKIVEVINKIVVTIIENLPLIISVALQIIIALAGGLIKAIPDLVKAVPELISAIVKAFSDGMKQIKEIGKDVVKGIWEGIKSMASWLSDKVKDFFSGITDNIKGILGISSPSKVFAGIGKFMAEGLGEGFGAEMQNVSKLINDSVPTNLTMTGQYQATDNIGFINGLAGILSQTSSQPIELVINLDSKVIARQIYDPLKNEDKIRGRILAGGLA